MELKLERAVGAVDGAIVDRAETWSEEALRVVDDTAVGWVELRPGGAFAIAEVVDDAAVDWAELVSGGSFGVAEVVDGIMVTVEAMEILVNSILVTTMLVLIGFLEGAREQGKKGSLRGEVRYILGIEAGNE